MPDDLNALQSAYEEALRLADGEAIEACAVLLAAVAEFLGAQDDRGAEQAGF